MTTILPPGTLLQQMYLRERLRGIPPGRFIEVGPGAGTTSALLLSLGWSGVAYDLEARTIDALNERFAVEIAAGRYSPILGDFLHMKPEPADLVISCMVIEHLDDAGAERFMCQAKDLLKTDGLIISFVPSSPAHWGIDDDIAGHFRRYTRESMRQLYELAGVRVAHLAGLTCPLSNALLPISNYLVRRREAWKLSLSMRERTQRSGIREVPMKTHFPAALGLILNERILYPLHLLQKCFSGSESALVLYCEGRRPTP